MNRAERRRLGAVSKKRLPQQETKVFIFVLSLGQVEAQFAICLAGMASTFGFPPEGCPPYTAAFVHIRDALICQGRERAIGMALKHKATHALFIDADQTFPIWTLHQLLMWNKPVVAANVVTKKLVKAAPTARNFDPDIIGGSLVYTKPESSGLEKIWRVGTGIMMIQTKVFEKVEQPWFPAIFRPERGTYQGEDWSFCEKVEAAGFDIFIDHDLSKHVGHIGPVEFTHVMAGAGE